MKVLLSSILEEFSVYNYNTDVKIAIAADIQMNSWDNNRVEDIKKVLVKCLRGPYSLVRIPYAWISS